MSLSQLDNFFGILADYLTEGRCDTRQDALRLCVHALKLGFDLYVDDPRIVITLPNGTDWNFKVDAPTDPSSVEQHMLDRIQSYIDKIEEVLGPALCENLRYMKQVEDRIKELSFKK